MKNLPLKWSLDALYKGFDSHEFLKDLEEFKKLTSENNLWAAENFASIENAGSKLEEYAKKSSYFEKFRKLGAFSGLTISVDSSNETAKKYNSLINSIGADANAASVLFQKFVAKLDNLDEVIANSSVLIEFDFVLKEIKNNSKYMLTEKEENLLTKLSLTGSDAWAELKEELYATLTADIELNGEMKTLPMTAIRNLAYSNDPKLRKAAYDAELAAYPKVETSVAYALNAVKGEVITVSETRGFKTPLDMTLHNARLDRETFDAMISAMRDSLPSFRKYFRKKAQMLGHKGALPFYDMFAPIGKVDLIYSYDEAAAFVVKNFTAFDAKLGEFTKTAFENAWVDAEPRSGKQGGAFCSSIYPVNESRIMTNFSDSFSNVTTLAHEFGHAYHNRCLGDHKGLNRHYSMPIAETASTFCESIICGAALESATKEEALVILENDISGVAQTIVDIYSRFLFEDSVFSQRKNGVMSPSEFKEMMLAAQKESYGDGLDQNFLHPYMWVCKPHYYFADANYYNFPYAYGQLFSKGLFAEYLKVGKDFVPKYEKLLSETGRNNLYEIGKLAGVNVRDKAFWAASLKLTEDDIEKFCNM